MSKRTCSGRIPTCRSAHGGKQQSRLLEGRIDAGVLHQACDHHLRLFFRCVVSMSPAHHSPPARAFMWLCGWQQPYLGFPTESACHSTSATITRARNNIPAQKERQLKNDPYLDFLTCGFPTHGECPRRRPPSRRLGGVLFRARRLRARRLRVRQDCIVPGRRHGSPRARDGTALLGSARSLAPLARARGTAPRVFCTGVWCGVLHSARKYAARPAQYARTGVTICMIDDSTVPRRQKA